MSFMNSKSLKKNPLCNKYIALLVIIAVLATIFLLGGSKNSSIAGANISNSQIEEVVAKWINQNPEAIIESIQNMQKKAMEEQMRNAKQNISKKKDELYNNSDDPQHAPKNYDVSVVEFFDYACGYCKRASTTVSQLVKDDKKLRFIHKHYPILGQASTEMSQIALAINISQPKYYLKFHKELMKSTKRGKAAALEAAKKVGANIQKINKTLEQEKSKIDSMIQQNLVLGSSIGVTGTPGFVIGEELIPGAMGLDAFKQKIAAQRSK